jgi:linearmycin/streptolysin S transport system permease protein
VTNSFDRARTIMWANARRLQGERRLPFFVIILPILIMLLVGTTFGTGNKRLVVGVVADRHDPLAQQLVTRMRRSAVIKPRTTDSVDAAQRAVRRGRLTAAVVVPSGYGDALRDGRDVPVRVIVQPGRSESAEARFGVSAVLARASVDVTTARALVETEGISFDTALVRAQRVTVGVPDVITKDKHPESPFSYTAPSNLVLFAFITALVTAGVLVDARRSGVTRRVLASPTAAGAVVAGEMVGAFLVALFQATLMLVVGSLLFGVAWGSPVGVVLVLFALALAASGCGLLLATFVRTPEQAIAFGPAIGIALGMLGGCMWPLEGVGATMRVIGHLVPHGWAMDAFIGLVFAHHGVGGIAGQLGVLTLYGVALLTLATFRLRRSVLN